MEPLATRAAHPDQACGAQRVEVLGHRLAADREAGGELGDGSGAIPTQAIEQQPPGRVGDGVEHGLHAVHLQPLGCIVQAVAATCKKARVRSQASSAASGTYAALDGSANQ